MKNTVKIIWRKADDSFKPCNQRVYKLKMADPGGDNGVTYGHQDGSLHKVHHICH
jgi:hypothetical protein